MKHTRILAKCVLRRSDGKILLLRRSKTDVRRPLQWDFPGGNVEDDEDFTDAAVRETYEEAGITLDRKNIHLAYTTSEITELGNICWLIFIGMTTTTKVKLSPEHDKYYWATAEESLEMITYHRQLNALKHIFDNKLFD